MNSLSGEKVENLQKNKTFQKLEFNVSNQCCTVNLLMCVVPKVHSILKSPKKHILKPNHNICENYFVGKYIYFTYMLHNKQAGSE